MWTLPSLPRVGPSRRPMYCAKIRHGSTPRTMWTPMSRCSGVPTSSGAHRRRDADRRGLVAAAGVERAGDLPLPVEDVPALLDPARDQHVPVDAEQVLAVEARVPDLAQGADRLRSRGDRHRAGHSNDGERMSGCSVRSLSSPRPPVWPLPCRRGRCTRGRSPRRSSPRYDVVQRALSPSRRAVSRREASDHAAARLARAAAVPRRVAAVGHGRAPEPGASHGLRAVVSGVCDRAAEGARLPDAPPAVERRLLEADAAVRRRQGSLTVLIR